MGLLVEARGLSAMGPGGLIFTSVSGVIRDEQLAVVSGPAVWQRTALMLALCGRLTLAGGTLHTAGSSTGRSAAAVLRDRIAVAQAPPLIIVDPHHRVRDAISERRLVCGKRMSVSAIHDACVVMGMDLPTGETPLQQLDPVERMLFSVALACSQHCDGVAVANVDADFSTADRLLIRQALCAVSKSGKTVIATCSDSGWGDVDISLGGNTPLTRTAERVNVSGEPKLRLPGCGTEIADKPPHPRNSIWHREDKGEGIDLEDEYSEDSEDEEWSS